MTTKSAVKKLQANGWYVEENERGFLARKDGIARPIILRCNGGWLGTVQLILIQTYFGQVDAVGSSDYRYCDSLAEAMRAA